MLIGYARVSTLDQNPDLQTDALKAAGCGKIIVDKISGSISQRPGLVKLKELLRPGDTVVIWRLDRLGRSLKDLLEWVAYLNGQGIALKSLHESIDTASATGKPVFHIFASLAEFERNLVIERTHAGLAAARARGKKGGRPGALGEQEIKRLIELYGQKQVSIGEICRMMGISKPTLYAYVKRYHRQPDGKTG